MRLSPPQRLHGFDYLGFHRYFLTFCTHNRLQHFARPDVVDVALMHLSQVAASYDIALVAYCFMPDHVHLLVEGRSESADGRRFIAQAKQASGYACRYLCAPRLWQRYGYEHVLRTSDATLAVARYILENPVRAGLVVQPEDYPFAGSLTHSVTAILMSSEIWEGSTSG
jgi:putative transposase